ncbi:MAG TPA: glycosyltransferase family 4 protein [Patescibacteria group bacterium]|nr:glycosyltransferase family 4 protein [Patescibacteria group bacterium]
MRILILNWRDIKHSWAGGSELYIHELAKRWVKLGSEVTLFCAQDIVQPLPDKEVIDGITIFRKGGKFSVYFWAFIYYFKYFRNKTDVILDVENGIPFFTPFYSRKKKVCLVYHVHGKQFFYELPFPISILGYVLEKYVFPLLYRNINIMAISKSTKRELERLGFKSKRISIVEPGVSINGSKILSVSKYNKPTVVYLGRIKKYKRIEILVNIMPKILEKIPNARLLIAGWGSEAPFIIDLAMKSKVRKRIELIGPVSEYEKKILLSKSWIFVNPSLHEGWGISVIETNLMGTPAIGFNVPGLSDSIKNGYNGYLCGDEEAMIGAIVKVLENKKLRENLSKNSKKWAHQFNWDNAAKLSLRMIKKT